MIETGSRRRWPRKYTGRIIEDNVDALRHIHCKHYEACLDDAVAQCKASGETWVCPPGCPGRKTFVAFAAKVQRAS